MKPIPVLGIPHYNRPDLLARCIASIDYPVDKLVIVQNGPADEMAHFMHAPSADDSMHRGILPLPDYVKEIIVITHPNAGVAGAWNEIIKLFPGASGTRDHWWLISNNDIAFASGDLQKMADCVEFHTEHAVEIALRPGVIYGNHGASWFGITRYGVEKVGLFDENIFPAYLEDCDWSYRADLLKVRRMDVPDVHAIHGDAARNITGSTTIHSDPELREKNHRTHGGNFDYYRAKWGGFNEKETFKTPFNDPHWPVWAWRFDPGHRAEQQW